MNPSTALRSMTGFAQAKRDGDFGALTLSLRGVNHRGLDLHFYQPFELAAFETAMRAMLKERIARGHIEIRISWVREAGSRGALNTETLKNYAALFRTAALELKLIQEPDLNALLTMPGVMSTQPSEAAVPLVEPESVLLAMLSECLAAFNHCREREGMLLCQDMLNELRAVELATAKIQELRATILPAFQEWLTERVRALLGESAIPVSRIVEECALLADRSDIQEEVTRLTVHAGELRRILGAGGPVGKQIDFLLQEMNRETNTTLAKSSNAGQAGVKITALGLAIKASIERIREQALNLE